MPTNEPIFNGRHRALVNRHLQDIVKTLEFDKNSYIERILLNALAISFSNKINSYVSKIIETELNLINKRLGINIHYKDFILLQEPYLEMIDKYEGVTKIVTELKIDLIDIFKNVKSFFINSREILIKNNFMENESDIDQIFFLTGETHDGNKNVAVFYNKREPIFCLKQRNLKIEMETSEFINNFMTNILNNKKWKEAKIIDNGDHGWVKWIKREKFIDLKSVREYYTHFGELMAVSSILNLNDIHHENIISSKNPIIVDYEAVMAVGINNSISSSIIKTEMLPHTIKYIKGIPCLEHSGIGNLFEESIYDDDRERSNTVLLNNEIQFSYNYINEIKVGLKKGFEEIIKRKHMFYSFLSKMKSMNRRVILKSTVNYCNIIDESMRPYLLSNNKKREEYIRKCLILSNEMDVSEKIIDAELKSCIKGDVPRFESKVDSLEIYNTYGYQDRLSLNFTDGYRHTLKYLKNLNKKIINQEVKIVSDSLSQIKKIKTKHKKNTLTTSPYKIIKNEFDEVRYQISKDSISFLKGNYHFFPFYENCIDFRIPPLDTFTGLGGYLVADHIINGTDTTLVSKKLMSHYDRYFQFSLETLNEISGGLYIGNLSAATPLFQIYNKLTKKLKNSLKEYSIKLTELIEENHKEMPTGIINGLSGILVLSQCFYNISKEIHWKLLTDSTFEKLKSLKKTEGEDVTYFSTENSLHHSGALCGLSHGQSGVMYAFSLYGLYNKDKKDECKKLITECLKFEIKNFDPISKNWPDFRIPVQNRESTYDFSWAHGGAGIFLSYSFINEHYDIDILNKFLLKNMNKSTFDKNIKITKNESNYSISNGNTGTFLIYRKIFKERNPLEEEFIFSRSDFSSTHSGIGLLRGIGGELIAFNQIIRDTDKKYPLLPHEILLK